MNVYAIQRSDFPGKSFNLVESGLSGGEVRQSLLDRYRSDNEDIFHIKLAEEMLYSLTDSQLSERTWFFKDEYVVVLP